MKQEYICYGQTVGRTERHTQVKQFIPISFPKGFRIYFITPDLIKSTHIINVYFLVIVPSNIEK